jgi:hypothetical protein
MATCSGQRWGPEVQDVCVLDMPLLVLPSNLVEVDGRLQHGLGWWPAVCWA